MKPLRCLLICALVWGLALGVCLAQQPAPQAFLPNLNHPLLKNVLSWWRGVPGLTGGDRFFDLITRNHGTLANLNFGTASGWSATDRRGGYAHVAFNGTSDDVNVGNLPAYDFANTTFSVCLWFKTTTSGVQQYIIDKRTSPTIGAGWWFRIDVNNTLNASLGADAGSVAGVSTVATVTDSAWHQPCLVATTDTVTVGNNVATLYLDGQFVGTTTATVNAYAAPNTGNLYMGTRTDVTTFLTGAIDDVLIWTRGLSGFEIATLYTLGPQGEAALVLNPGADVAASLGNLASFFPFFQ